MAKIRNLSGEEIEYLPCHDRDCWIYTTDKQKTDAILVGKGMREFSKARGHKVWEAKTTSDYQMMRNQALGELCQMIFCVGIEIPITHRPQSYGDAPDLEPDIQIRLIGKEYYGLRVKAKDKDHWRVVGIVVTEGRERQDEHRCPGWFYVREARQHPEWEIEPHGPPSMHCVPQEFLRPMWELDTSAVVRRYGRQTYEWLAIRR